MKRFGSICLVFILLLQCLPAVSAQSDPSVISGCQSVDAALPLAPSEKLLATARAAMVFERSSGTMVYAWNPDEQIYPSSMVKLMTALVALEHGDLSDVVVVTRSALNQVAPGAVSMRLVEGEELTLEQLLYGMMVGSANDASTVIAQHVAGSQDRFLHLMNQKAAELGCTGTNYSNVHGLHDPQTYTTARDVTKILLAGLENEVFAEMFRTVTYEIPATNKSEGRTVSTTNNMMLTNKRDHYDSRVTGGKTGSTDAAGRCLAITAEGNDMELVCLVMGAEPIYSEDGTTVLRFGSFEEMKDLLDFSFGNYAFHQVFTERQIIDQFPVENGANHVAVMPNEALSAVLPLEFDRESLRIRYESKVLTAPVEAGESVSTLQVWYENVCLGQLELLTANDAPILQSPIMDVRPSESDDRGSWEALWMVLAVLAGIVIVVLLVRLTPKMLRKLKLRSIRRRRRRSRRRLR